MRGVDGVGFLERARAALGEEGALRGGVGGVGEDFLEVGLGAEEGFLEGGVLEVEGGELGAQVVAAAEERGLGAGAVGDLLGDAGCGRGLGVDEG
jgi:hypothetical protein